MNFITTEEVQCELCGSNDSVLLFADKKLSPSGEKGIVRCTSCGLVYRNIRLQASSILDNYEKKNLQNLSEDWTEGIKEHYKPYMGLITSFRKYNRILDIGAGPGFFLSMCKDRGWDCYGIEPSVECRTFAAEHYGIQLSHAVLGDGQYEDGFFDVVTFWNVLEVLPNPKRTLSLVYHILRPGGAVLIRSINASFHVPARKAFKKVTNMFPKFSALDQSVFHQYSFDKKTLTRLLSMTQFEDISVEPAKLAWTTLHSAKSDIFKKISSRIIDSISRIMYGLTNGKLISPSLLAIAIKPIGRYRENN